MNHLTYITTDINQLNNVDFSQIEETSKDTVRKSLDESKFVAKWEGETPETITNIPESDKGAEMNHTEARTLMSTPEWSESNPPE
tara:strand:- start:1011 stop:1265 length:255 start_codon:yes stop_codon:yes gene_type:complete